MFLKNTEMSEVWWLSSTSKIQLMLSLLKSDLFLFVALILSHPVYFLYFIFFSPYLFKLLSFLSPLFITTSLFLLAFLSTTAIDDGDNGYSSISTGSTEVSFIITAYRSVVEGLRSRIDNTYTRGGELLCLEDFEVFRIVFDTPVMIHDNDDKGCRIEVSDPALPPVFPCPKSLASDLEAGNSVANELKEKLDVDTVMVMEDEKRLEAFLQELDEFDGNVEEEKEEEEEEEEGKIEVPITKVNKVTVKQEEKCHLTNGSEAVEVERGNDKGGQSNKTGVVEKNSDEKSVDSEEKNMSSLSVESSRALEYINLGSYGSMRREKDWKRTLAGKLFEERNTNNNVNNNGGSEVMDLLWETYESTEESASKKTKNKNDTKEEKKNKNNNNNNSNKKKSDHDMMKKYYPVKKKEHEQKQEEEEEDEESDESEGQLCCLQALKFSTTGKMNMGMGRPSLVKISKAIKGFGWLHHVSSRHSKKVHIGDRF